MDETGVRYAVKLALVSHCITLYYVVFAVEGDYDGVCSDTDEGDAGVVQTASIRLRLPR